MTDNASQERRYPPRRQNTAASLPPDIAGRLVPRAVEIEAAVLGALMLEKDAFSLVCDLLKPESFYEPRHAIIYSAIQSLGLSEEPIDMITVTNKLRNNGALACDCAKVTTIKSSLLRRFYKDVKSKFEAHAITDEEYIALMSSKLISTELQFKTFNNEDLYTDETFKDIAQRVNAQQKLEIDEFKIKDTERLNKCKLLSSKISSWIVNIIGSVFLILALVSKFWDISSNSIFQLVFGYSMVFFFTLWGILNWLKIFPTKERLHNYFENKIFDLLRRNLL